MLRSRIVARVPSRQHAVELFATLCALAHVREIPVALALRDQAVFVDVHLDEPDATGYSYIVDAMRAYPGAAVRVDRPEAVGG